MLFRKIPTILLLFSVIAISLGFSILLDNKNREGMTELTAVVQEQILDIINNPSLQIIDKVSQIKPLIGIDVAANDIFNENINTWFNYIVNYIQNPPTVSNIIPLDNTNVLSPDQRQTIIGIINNPLLSTQDKIIQIYPNIGSDATLILTYAENGKSLLDMMQKYICLLSGTCTYVNPNVIVNIPTTPAVVGNTIITGNTISS